MQPGPINLDDFAAARAESHKAWIADINETQNNTIVDPIFADADKKVSDLYGMVHPNPRSNLTVRSMFIFDPNKKLRLQITDPAAPAATSTRSWW